MHRRNSAGGQALEHWQRTGKLTTIHIVYELDGPLTVEQLKVAIDEKLCAPCADARGRHHIRALGGVR